jgi:nucleoside-diphosphate-sugar epimerase
MPASDRRALVTGGTGSIGRRVVSRLLAGGWNVAVMTRQTDLTPPDDVMFLNGDLGDAASLREAVAHRDLVVHCALSSSGVDVRAAATLADASIAARVRRFVHVSTMSVYPVVASGTIDESCPYVAPGTNDPYSLMKASIVEMLLRRADRLHVGVIQPANVVNPDGGWWTTGVVSLMRRAKFMMIDGGSGTANLVHVGDVAAAAELAATADYASGSRFLIADGHPIPWAGYLRHLESLAGGNALEDMTAAEAKRYSRAVTTAPAFSKTLRRMKRALTGARAILPMDDIVIDRFASRAVVSIDRAKAVLGYSPSRTRWPSIVR